MLFGDNLLKNTLRFSLKFGLFVQNHLFAQQNKTISKKKKQKYTFLYKYFVYIKKKQYLCTRFQAKDQ